jgi:predicted alpha/beta superfamily hydrolase
MKEIKRFQIRGVAGDVKRVDFDGRIVDYWLPKEPATHLLIAHDGQNVFDGRTSTHRGQTWKMAQSANRVIKELGIVPPAIIGVWHSSTKENPWGRGKDLVPEKYFRDGISVAKDVSVPSDHPDFLHGDTYLRSIFEEYVPAIAPAISPSRTAMIGSSMGGLATLYAVAQLPDKFTTALALSTHWPFGGNELVERIIKELPSPSTHKIWMSHGTKGLDSAYAPFQHLADKLMAERGYLPHNFVTKVYERSGHNERSWAKYLDQPMRFWLNT